MLKKFGTKTKNKKKARVTGPFFNNLLNEDKISY